MQGREKTYQLNKLGIAFNVKCSVICSSYQPVINLTRRYSKLFWNGPCPWLLSSLSWCSSLCLCSYTCKQAAAVGSVFLWSIDFSSLGLQLLEINSDDCLCPLAGFQTDKITQWKLGINLQTAELKPVDRENGINEEIISISPKFVLKKDLCITALLNEDQWTSFLSITLYLDFIITLL